MHTHRETFDYKKLGEKIKAARKNKHYSQGNVAELTNLSNNYISDIERGIKRPLLPTVIDIANCLQMDASELLHPWLHTTFDYRDGQLNKRLQVLSPEQRTIISATLETMIDQFINLNSHKKG